MREHATAIDVRHQHDRAIHALSEPHVGDIAITQVHFRRTSRPFNDDRVKTLLKPGVRGENGIEGDGFERVIRAGIKIGVRVAVDDHLRAAIAGRLEQHGIEVDFSVHARRDRLQRLCASDLAAVHRHRAVQRHVLGLERRDAHATAPREPA